MINLFFEYFVFEKFDRQIEIQQALHHNCQLPFINKIYIFVQPKNFTNIVEQTQKYNHIAIIKNTKRTTFQHVFDYCNKVTKRNDTNVLINSDIKIDPSFVSIKKQLTLNDFYCLTRWEPKELVTNKFKNEHHKSCSQDTWCWKGKCRIKKCDFFFGILGCDNTLANMAHKHDYNVVNPCHHLITIHCHESNIRACSIKENYRLPKENYSFIPAS